MAGNAGDLLKLRAALLRASKNPETLNYWDEGVNVVNNCASGEADSSPVQSLDETLALADILIAAS